MKKRLLLFLLLSLFIGHFKLQAQALTVIGTITDAQSGDKLPGVSVAVQGTTKGVISDLDGKYSIEVSDANAVLVFTYVGFITETIQVSGKSVIDLKLLQDIKKLDEVVVVGYGTAKRGNLTTAQTTISAKDMERTVNTTIEQAIQGRTAGVYITQNSGQPGGGISVNIRGVNSINGTNEPLYVIDGVQIAGQSISSGAQSSSNPLAGINPSDIEDIQVLQGPSATAMYGSRATNGVLLITTKQGKAGDMKVNYGYSYSLQAPPKYLSVMNLRQYAQMVNDVEGNSAPIEFKDPSLLGEGTDWQKELLKQSAMYKHQLSISGGGEKTTYYLSSEYLSQDGIAAGSGFDRYGFRLNLNSKPKKWLNFGANFSFNQTKEKLTTSDQNLIYNALTETPQTPVKNLDGTWGGGDTYHTPAQQFSPVNPVAIASLITNNNTRRQFLGGINMEATLLKGLVFRTAFNTNIGYSNSIVFTPTYSFGWAQNKSASLTDGAGNNTYWGWNQLLEYRTQIEKHSFDVMVSHEAQESTWKNTGSTRSGYLVNNILDLNAGDPTLTGNSGGQGNWGMESYFGRVNYNYAERYIVEGSVRTDGSSNFGPDNRWGVFPAVSLAWRITKEPWFPQTSVLNEFKIRLETGTTGNQGNTEGIYSPMTTAASQWGTGFLPSRYSNPGLKWEQTKTNNIGANLNFFSNRIQVELDYYKKSTDNLLMPAQEPYYMGTTGIGGPGSPMVNIGTLENKGWGLTLISTNINSKKFKWESNFNISAFKTEITKLYTNSAFVDRTSWWMNSWTQRSTIGQAPWLFRGYIQEGLFQSVDEINNSAVPVDNNGNRLATNVNNVWVGDIKYKDVSGPDGIPDGKIDTYDQTDIGNPWPKFFGGFTNSFTYKGFELSILLTFSQGNDIYNYVALQSNNPHNVYLGRNFMTTAENFAKLTTATDGSAVISNPGADLPRLSISNGDVNGNWNRFTNKWVEDGSYLRIKNISLAYTLPSVLVTKQKLIKDAKLIFSAQNIATITGYKGYDPEVGAYVGQNADPTTQAIGVDYGRYPLTPIYTFNLILNF